MKCTTPPAPFVVRPVITLTLVCRPRHSIPLKSWIVLICNIVCLYNCIWLICRYHQCIWSWPLWASALYPRCSAISAQSSRAHKYASVFYWQTCKKIVNLSYKYYLHYCGAAYIDNSKNCKLRTVLFETHFMTAIISPLRWDYLSSCCKI